MRPTLDAALYQGQLGADALAHVLVDGVSDAGLVVKVEEAVRRCPTDAICVDV